MLLAKDRPDLPTTLPDEFFDFARVANLSDFRPEFPVNITFEHKIRLLGYDLGLGAHEAALPVITLYWQTLEPLDRDYTLWPFFIDRAGRLIEDPSERPLVTTLWYPTSAWSPDEIIITRTLPWDLGQEFTLAVGVANQSWVAVDQRLSITDVDEPLYTFENKTWVRLGAFQQVGRSAYQPLSTVSPLPQQPQQAQFWNLISLDGADLPTDPLQAGQALPFALQWQSSDLLTVDLTTFAHLLDAQGNTVAQLDWTPQDSLGYLPTTAWQPQRTVIDRQTLPLPDTLASGQYRLVVGWYYGPTGDRLPLTAGEGTDTTEVGTITIK